MPYPISSEIRPFSEPPKTPKTELSTYFLNFFSPSKSRNLPKNSLLTPKETNPSAASAYIQPFLSY